MAEARSTGVRYTFSKRDPNEPRAEYPSGADYRVDHAARDVVQTFDSLQDALGAAVFTSKSNQHKWADVETGAISSDTVEWYGVAGGVAAVRRVISHGWADGAAKVRAALEDLGGVPVPRSVRRVRQWADQGDALDIHRVWSGQLDAAWQRTRRLQRPGSQQVTIAANVTAMAGVDGRELFWRGAAVLKLADLLTAAGYNVKIVAVRDTRLAYTDGYGIVQRVTVKEPTAPLDLDALAATVCLAGFFRTVLFQCQCNSNGGRKVTSERGFSRVYKGDGEEIVGVEQCRNAESARRWIEQAIEKLNQPQ